MTSRPGLNQYITDWYNWVVLYNAFKGTIASRMDDEHLTHLHDQMNASQQAMDEEDKKAWSELSSGGSGLGGEKLKELCRAAQSK